MKASINGLLSFGLVTVPVGIASAVSEKNEVSFRTLHQPCKQPVHMQTVANEAKKNGDSKASHVTPVSAGGVAQAAMSWCGTCNVEATETVPGFEFAKGQFIVFTEEEVAQAKGQRERVIRLSKFVKRDEILPTLVNKQYFLVPNPHVDDAYGLLYQALAETKSVGVGRQSLWGKESPCAVIADQSFEGRGVLMMMLLHCWEDLVVPDFSAPIPDKEAKKLAKDLIAVSTGTLEPSDLTSTTRERLGALIEAKLEGFEIPAVETAEEPEVTMDIQEMLRRSIELLAESRS